MLILVIYSWLHFVLWETSWLNFVFFSMLLSIDPQLSSSLYVFFPILLISLLICWFYIGCFLALYCLCCCNILTKTDYFFFVHTQDLAVVVLLILIPLISPNSSKGGVTLSSTFCLKYFITCFHEVKKVAS